MGRVIKPFFLPLKNTPLPLTGDCLFICCRPDGNTELLRSVNVFDQRILSGELTSRVYLSNYPLRDGGNSFGKITARI